MPRAFALMRAIVGPDGDEATARRLLEEALLIEVDPLLCIGCNKCISKGPDNTFLEGCPWNAIDMVPLAAYEAERGELPY